jgi:hypothetical protein
VTVVVVAAILVLAFLAPALSFVPAFAQAQNELRFSPAVSTKKSNIYCCNHFANGTNGLPQGRAAVFCARWQEPVDKCAGNPSSATDDQGSVNLVGEVQNTAGQPVTMVQVDVAFFEGEYLVIEEQRPTPR